MYNEHNRIRPSSEHPNGEDFLRVKVHQLNWLFKEFPNYSWDLTLVDDGCPNNSGNIAEKIISEAAYPNVEVLFLEQAIQKGHLLQRKWVTHPRARRGLYSLRHVPYRTAKKRKSCGSLH